MVASIKCKTLLLAVLPFTLCVAQVGPTGGGGAGSAGPRGATGLTGAAGPAPSGTGAVVVNSGVASAVAVSGDGTLNPSTGALTVTKTNGSTFAAVATSGSAGDLSSGTLPHARLPALLSGDIPANAANTSGNAATAISLASAPTLCAAGSYTLGIGIAGNAQNCTALPAFPAGAIVGTADTQALTNKTVDGVSPTTMGYLDATSSVQTQLNTKAASNASTTVNGQSCALGSTCIIPVPSGTCTLTAQQSGTVTLNDSNCTGGTLTGPLPWANLTMTINGATTLAAPTLNNGFHQINIIQDGTGGRAVAYNAVFGNPPPQVTPAGTTNWYSFVWTGSVATLTTGGNTSGFSQVQSIAAPTYTVPSGYMIAYSDTTTNLPNYQTPAGTVAKPIIVDGTTSGANQTSGVCNAGYSMKGLAKDANPDCTPVVTPAGTQTVTGLKTFNPGTFTSAIWPIIINTSETTDKLTSNGANQYFSMNSNAAVMPTSSIVSGQRFTLTYIVDQVVTTNSGALLTPVLCSVAGCGGGTVVPLTGTTASNFCFTGSTCSFTFHVACVGTAAAGASATIICSVPEDSFYIANHSNNQSSIITGVPTNGALYVNMRYNQTTQAGNVVSMIVSAGDWDRL